MYKYEVTYWQEGDPGRSDYVTVLVAAVNQKAAIKHVIEKHAVYKVDIPGIKAKKVKGTVEAFTIEYVETPV
jgi:hypothetical protein